MEYLISDIEKALDNGLYFIALQSTLTLPDICASLEDKTYSSLRERYETWFNTNVHTNEYIDGLQAWNFRCKMSHQGISAYSNDVKNKRIVFAYPDDGNIVSRTTMTCGDIEIIGIDLIQFCKDIILSVRQWQVQAKETQYYQEHYNELIKVGYMNMFIGGMCFIG